MLPKRKKTISTSRTVVRPVRTSYQNFTRAIADVVHDHTMNADSKVEFLKRFTAPYLETETVELTERRVA